MQRRVVGAGVLAPPDELVCYETWCGKRGVAAFGVAGDPVSMAAAVAQYRVWEGLRSDWASRHGVDEETMDLDGSEPWDEDKW